MRKLPLALLRPEMTLAKTVWNERGDLLLAAGSALTTSRIDRLRDLGHLAAYIQDGDLGHEIAMHDMIQEETRRQAANSVRDLHAFLAEAEERRAKQAGQSTSDVVQKAARGGALLNQVLATVGEILDEIMDGDLVLGLSALKTRDGYAFQHGVDTAVTAAFLATKLQIPSRELRSLVSGCLVMDIGNIALPREVLESGEHLEIADTEARRRHTEEGYEIVRSLGLQDVLAAHIPFQHHERQDGTGYPRGLRGTNRVRRTDTQLLDGHYLLQIAEIASIADVYDALCADRPHREACPVDQATLLIRDMAGGALNEEMVGAFLSLVPVWPLGSHVQLDGGRWIAMRAVVVDQDRLAADRPIVQIYQDEHGAPAEGQVRTVEFPDLMLSALDSDGLAA